MKILFVLELFYPNIGGIEKLFISIGERLVKKGHQVTVITTKFDKSLPSLEYFKGIEIRRLSLCNRFLFTFFSFPVVYNHARKSDIIHTTSYNAAFPAWLASKLTGTKAIITFHEVWGKLWFKFPFMNFFQKLFYSAYEQFILRLNFNLFIAVSNSTKNELLKAGVNKRRVLRIYNGLFPHEYQYLYDDYERSNQKFTCTYFGRLGSSKGIDLLMNASEKFLVEEERKLVIISSDEPIHIYKKIKRWIDKNQLHDKVDLIKHLPYLKLKQELLKSDCVVIPSISEGFCFAAAESIGMGIPVVVSGKAALKEVVSGKFIEMKEFSSNGLYDALIQASKGKWNNTPIKKFLLKKTMRGYLSVYDGLLSLNQ